MTSSTYPVVLITLLVIYCRTRKFYLSFIILYQSARRFSLFSGSNRDEDSLRCAHCQMYKNGSCLHPLGFIPPITECGATHSRCGTILMEVENVLKPYEENRFWQFGITFEGIASIYKLSS